MNRRDLSAALYHLERMAAPLVDPHRLALESLLLAAVIALDSRERDDIARKAKALAN